MRDLLLDNIENLPENVSMPSARAELPISTRIECMYLLEYWVKTNQAAEGGVASQLPFSNGTVDLRTILIVAYEDDGEEDLLCHGRVAVLV